MLYIVAAVSDNNVIGVDGKLPWKLKKDLAWFRMNTFGGAVIMGRKTWESLPKAPLPQRLNIVLTRGSCPDDQKNVVWRNTLKEAIVTATKRAPRVYIIGGSDIFYLATRYPCDLLITRVHCTVNCTKGTRDIVLPARKTLVWQSAQQQENELQFHFQLYITH